MVHWLRNLPIRHKLICISLFTSGAVLLMACAAIFTYEQLKFKQSLSRDLSITAEMIALNSTAALSFHDTSAAQQTLQSLHVHPNIVAACIFDPEGELFASYSRDSDNVVSWPAARSEESAFGENHLELFREIRLGGDVLGTIFIRSDLEQVSARFRRYMVIIALVLVASILLAWLLAARLQRVISVPILNLASVASRVAEGTDFSIRATKLSDDELGLLTDDFNNMLTRIERQNTALKAAHDGLEKRVEERTAELERAQKEAAREHARFRFIFNALPVGVAWMIQGKTESRIVNPAFARISGVPLELSCNLDLYREATHPEDRTVQTKLHQRVYDGEIDSYQMEKRYRRDDGESYDWAQLTNAFLRDDNGTIQELSTLVDISERKQAEEELASTHRRLLDASRQAGMAEVATSVLHNVGNVLNSVNISASVVDEKVRRSKAASVAKLSDLFARNKEDLVSFLTEDPQGKRIPEFLESLARHLGSEHQEVLTELKLLRSNVDHIKQIVAMQQRYAKISGVTETVSVVALVEDALSMSSGAFERHAVSLVRDFQSEPTITVERHNVLQVLVNLLRNAKYACDEGDAPDKRVIVRVTAAESRVQVSVIDNGVGIAPENMGRIFGHGFTTRKDGHGFGLHSGALAAKAMGGSLRVQSEGIGKGAEFILDLPFSPPNEDM